MNLEMQKIEKNMQKHNENLSEFATHDKDAIRFYEEQNDFRTPFFRDTDRIIYSMAYTRYMDKTQVFSYQKNDHISKRMIHVQLVSKIARTIGRALNLNEDLIEAAALGHDLGHVPFGHVGEAILNRISLEYKEGYFHHNIQSVRLLMEIEKSGKGSNITLQVLDAIMCHNGEFLSREFHPKLKSKEDFLKEYQSSYLDSSVIKKLIPMTLEGCVVRISDLIAYLGRDINDACVLHVFDKQELPKEVVDVLGIHNRDIINKIVTDIITNSINKNYISMSQEIYQIMKVLKQFNMERIYLKANSKESIAKYEVMFRTVFDECLKDIKHNNRNSKIFRDFLDYKNLDYQKKNTNVRKVIDYIAGMTDNYLLMVYSDYKK